MKKKRWLMILLCLIILIMVGIVSYRILHNETKLSSDERRWINENINNIQNIYVIKDENIFAKDGHGIFYEFLNDFSSNYGIKLNIISFDGSISPNNINLNVEKELKDNTIPFYIDHYVLLSKNNEIITDISTIKGSTIGVLNTDINYVKNYLKDLDINYNGYENLDDLIKDVNSSVNYIILPRIKYLDSYLSNDLEIVYHFSDISNYYVLNVNNDYLSSILKKYMKKWQTRIDDELKEEEFAIFVKSLNISATDVDKLQSIDYNYGFINNSPYEIIMSGNYGGITSRYLEEFSKFSKIYFNITKYRNVDKLVKAINKDKVDIYFAFNNNIDSNYLKTTNGIKGSISIITKKDNKKVFNSLYGLIGEDVYVEAGSHIYNYLNKIDGIKLHTVNKLNDLFKLNKKDVIIAMDSYIFDYYNDTKLNNYISKYDTFIKDNYTFRVKNNYELLAKLLDKYINYLDNKEMIFEGLNSHLETVTNGNILNNLAKYFIISITILLILGICIYRRSKKIRIAKRLNKDDKLKFIDDLTCLKNRAYLSDFIKTWSNNTIYPQAIVVVDLNRIKEINDKYGVTEGDKQIQAAANALIKTQLDNSDLMRSDGNEFVVYIVGYNQKQIINYIHKLNKELKKLPYNYGAEFGYSIIENNLKTIEDALNEASIDMRSKKDVASLEKKNS